MTGITEFQKRVLDTIEASPNEMADTWEIAWNGFPKEWNKNRRGHGALIRCILNAGKQLSEKGRITILPGRDQYDAHTFSSTRKWKDKP